MALADALTIALLLKTRVGMAVTVSGDTVAGGPALIGSPESESDSPLVPGSKLTFLADFVGTAVDV